MTVSVRYQLIRDHYVRPFAAERTRTWPPAITPVISGLCCH